MAQWCLGDLVFLTTIKSTLPRQTAPSILGPLDSSPHPRSDQRPLQHCLPCSRETPDQGKRRPPGDDTEQEQRLAPAAAASEHW